MVEYIPGRVACPLAGVGARAANASNRLVVEPGTEVTIKGSTIALRDDRVRPKKTAIADLVWLAEGRDHAGRAVPFTIHLEVTKLGRDYAIDLHTHEPRPLDRAKLGRDHARDHASDLHTHESRRLDPTARDHASDLHAHESRRLDPTARNHASDLHTHESRRLDPTARDDASDLHTARTLDRATLGEDHPRKYRSLARNTLVYEPLEIAVDGKLLVDRARLADAVARVPLARRAAAALTTTRDHLTGVVQDPAAVGYRVLDRSIGIGAFGRGAMLVRARLTSLAASNAPLIARGSLVEMLRDGAWELSLEALTERTLPELVARDLELFGLAQLPLLREVRAGKLRRGQVLAFRCVPGAPEVRLDDQSAPLPDALDIARAYLEFHMLGGMLTAAAGS